LGECGGLVLLPDALWQLGEVFGVPLHEQLLILLPVVSRVLQQLVDQLCAPQEGAVGVDLGSNEKVDLLLDVDTRDLSEGILHVWREGLLDSWIRKHQIDPRRPFLLVVDVLTFELFEEIIWVDN